MNGKSKERPHCLERQSGARLLLLSKTGIPTKFVCVLGLTLVMCCVDLGYIIDYKELHQSLLKKKKELHQ